MSQNIFAGRSTTLVDPALDVAPITPGAGDIIDPADSTVYVARALLCGSAGLATIETLSGKTRVGVPLVQGWNPIGAKQLTVFNTQNASYPTFDSGSKTFDSGVITFDTAYANANIWGVRY
jgi:hypothetical protein